MARGHKKSVLRVGDLDVAVTRKAMKYIRLRVLPPHGEVVVSAPHRVSNREIAILIHERLGWISRERSELRRLSAIELPRFESGEQHSLWGETYHLQVIPGNGRRRTALNDEKQILLYCRAEDDERQRAAQLEELYRSQLRQALTPLTQVWQVRTGKQASFFGIKRMKTRWGSCNITRARIWLNVELARHPLGCLEYVLVHELVHLYESGHGPRFRSLMDHYLPGWLEWHDYLNKK